MPFRWKNAKIFSFSCVQLAIERIHWTSKKIKRDRERGSEGDAPVNECEYGNDLKKSTSPEQ
jgi:hypothetical protein